MLLLRARCRLASAACAACTAVLLPLAACGDDEPARTGDDGSPGADAGADGGGRRSLTFTAVDIDFEEDEATAAAGEVQVALTNEGAIEHSWVVEGREADLRLYTQQAGQTDEGSITLEAGSYTYYCDIPGHRQAGMDGELTVE